MEEKWKEVVGFEGIYYISSLGCVRKFNSYILTNTPNKNRHGYCYANLAYGGKRKNCLVHQLVAKHFIPNPLSKPTVNHIDFDVGNNKLENLEWATFKENSNHSVRAGRMARLRGEMSGKAKLTLKTVRKIRKRLLEGKLTHCEIAKKYHTNYSNVAHIKRGSRWGFTL